MTASERIRAARVALDEFNRILAENGHEPTTVEELEGAGIFLLAVEETGKVPVEVEVRAIQCEGHPAGPYDPMGQTVYCDGRCRPR